MSDVFLIVVPYQWHHSLLTRVDKVQGPQGPRGPQVLLVKICVTKLSQTRILTSDTLTLSGECYDNNDIINSNVQPKSKVLLVSGHLLSINLSVRILCIDIFKVFILERAEYHLLRDSAGHRKVTQCSSIDQFLFVVQYQKWLVSAKCVYT